MGSALAAALFRTGFATTVWNRTASKAEPLSQLGLSVARNVLEAVQTADVIVISLRDYNSTLQLLKQPEIEAVLGGKTIVQLSSGTPQHAREMQSWASRCGISYLDGAVVSYPKGIGTPEGAILYSGPEEIFDRVKPVLMAFGDQAIFVGAEIGHASAIDVATLTFSVNAMLGFIQGYVVWEGENLPAEGYLQAIKEMMPFLETIVTEISRRLQAKDYRGDQASLEAYSVVTRHLTTWLNERRLDHRIADAHLSLMERAIQAGNGQSDFAYLREVLSAKSLVEGN
jgi:3-hydroxyisobutyrate dehydrogenase-like beta-hydroxyacid dehydrogenase